VLKLYIVQVFVKSRETLAAEPRTGGGRVLRLWPQAGGVLADAVCGVGLHRRLLA
jgi:hypothetical protein